MHFEKCFSVSAICPGLGVRVCERNNNILHILRSIFATTQSVFWRKSHHFNNRKSWIWKREKEREKKRRSDGIYSLCLLILVWIRCGLLSFQSPLRLFVMCVRVLCHILWNHGSDRKRILWRTYYCKCGNRPHWNIPPEPRLEKGIASTKQFDIKFAPKQNKRFVCLTTTLLLLRVLFIWCYWLLLGK